MTSESSNLMMIGTNHRQAPVDFREKIAFLPEEMPDFLTQAHRTLNGSDCFLISTCNRTEFYTFAKNGASQQIWNLLLEHKAIEQQRDANKFYQYEGRQAVEQLFRVACGIDSLMLGEPQILQQVKSAHETSVQARVAGVVGERLLIAAIRCGKRARTETEISKGAVSVALAAVSLAHKVFADLTPRTAMVIGAGETGSLVAKNLCEHGIGRLLVVNRTVDRARSLATLVRGEPLALDDLPGRLHEADIVITATGAAEPLLTLEMARQASKKRHNRSMLIVDIGVPRNVAREVRNLENVFLNDIDSLQGMIEQNLLRRRREVPKVEKVIAEEVDRFLEWFSGLQAGPIIKQLRGSLEAVRQQEIERLRGLSPEQRETAEQVTHGLINKLLHRPTRLLREADSQGEAGLRRIQTIREIFGLEDDPDGSARDRSK